MGAIGLLLKSDVEHIIDEAFEYLSSQRSSIDGKSGWHQFLETGKIGNIATAQILILHAKYNRKISALDSCFAWFGADRREIVWKGETITGWSYLSSGPAVPCVEPTCWVYLANQILSPDKAKEVESGVHAFLTSTQISSQEGVSWGFVPWTEPRVLSTCIAVRILSKIQDSKIATDAVRWLLAARDSQNAWGNTAKSSATLTHTAHAILALREAGYSPQNPALLDGYAFLIKGIRKWLVAKQRRTPSEDNEGFMEIIDIPPCPPFADRPTRIQYYFNPLVLSAIALCSGPEQFLPYAEAIAVEALRDWPRTRWRHPFLHGHQHVTSWSIFDHLSVLEPFRPKWFHDQKCSVAYLISSHGAFSVRLGHMGNAVQILRNRYVGFFVRSAILIGVILTIVYYLLRGLDPKYVAMTVMFGLISNLVYEYLKR
jgi:hypothetical protein